MPLKTTHIIYNFLFEEDITKEDVLERVVNLPVEELSVQELGPADAYIVLTSGINSVTNVSEL